MNRLNETLFEERITAELMSQPLYNQRKAKDFDKHLLDEDHKRECYALLQLHEAVV